MNYLEIALIFLEGLVLVFRPFILPIMLHLFGLKFTKKPSVYPDTEGSFYKFYSQKTLA